jgi:hypothetical protein
MKLPELEFAYTAYCRRHDPSPPMYTDELWDLVGKVHQADCQSAAAGRLMKAGTASESPAGAKAWGRLENKLKGSLACLRRGSLHSDIWRGTAADLAEKGHVIVKPVRGWWSDRPHLGRWRDKVRYSLIVTIETARQDVDIYTPVETQVSIPV